MKAPKLEYQNSEQLKQAIGNIVGKDNAKYLGGGQSLGPMLNLRLARPDTLVDLSKIEDLRVVEVKEDAVFYGAAITHSEFEDGKVVDYTNGMLRGVAKNIAYRAVRNVGTIGGSIAHADPAADWVSVMIALDATIHLAGPKKNRQVLASEFMSAAFMTALRPEEIILGVSVPILSKEARWGYYKFCRKQGEFSDATGSVVIDPNSGYARVVVGALDDVPITLEEVADTLAEFGIESAIRDVKASIDKLLSGYEDHRRKLLSVSVIRALLQLEGKNE